MTTKERSSKLHSFGFTLIATLLVVPLMTVGAYLALRSNNGNNVAVATTEKLTEKINIVPTPFPFQEMTIPALSSRTYESRLGSLEELSENVNYSSFLTSYDSDGLKINGLLTIPKTKNGGEKFPAIVFVHGYISPGEYKTSENYVSYMDYLAKSGC
ncbi:MAG: Dipeptidyl peptidase IV-related protein [Candidatus Woesebacteria bacterium GW2011_GWB1_38_5]|uniref:Dipeptidyl peptidase IV-related protein n=1 Tax=Candidatus Woesebacteria bacterium GW2011_GWB1_38_5 TaxID=1618568 RepID=A0A0G0MLZ3_9BACT|nr:MAG: Dipeptidyl peptidase IV-related protein [Candidatus Woesebacteria bacterium GW2011_GWB1_38_5]